MRAGAAPTMDRWDCRPYRWGTAEHCAITLTQPAEVHLMVLGWAKTSDFTLAGAAQGKADAAGLPEGPPRGEPQGCAVGNGASSWPALLMLLLVLVVRRRR